LLADAAGGIQHSRATAAAKGDRRPVPSFDTDRMLAGIRDWVLHETPTDAPERVSALAARIGAEIAAAGAHTEIIPGRDGRGDHLVVRSPWRDGANGTGILVLSHLDTVHPVGELARNPFRVEGDSAFGPGIYDMKGGAYLAHHALRELLREGKRTKLPITHVYVSDEEVGTDTARALIEGLAASAKYVLVTEPARDGGRIVVARKGTARFDMTIRGRPAHSGARHEDGRSAIKELARQILVLEGFTDYARGITVNVGVVAGGTRPNVVAGHARAEIDMRVANPAQAEEMVAKVLGLAPHDPDVTVTVTGGMNRPPYEQDARGAALFQHARGLAAEIGIDLVGVKTGGGSDGNFTAHVAPTLDGLGVDGKGGHTGHEQLYVSSIAPRGRLMYRLFETLA
jgi:glutamate carboxypeptidase